MSIIIFIVIGIAVGGVIALLLARRNPVALQDNQSLNLLLQDFDQIAESNDSTSLLTNSSLTRCSAPLRVSFFKELKTRNSEDSPRPMCWANWPIG